MAAAKGGGKEAMNRARLMMAVQEETTGRVQACH